MKKKVVVVLIVVMLLLVTATTAFALEKNGAKYCKQQTDLPFAECMKAPAHWCWDEPYISIFGDGNHGKCVKTFMSDFYK